jgi:hypothetical protein
MPFIYDNAQDEWTDDDTEPPPPRVDQFIYFPAADFGGGSPPVRFEVPLLRPSDQRAAPEQPAQPDPGAPAGASRQEGGGVRQFLQRWLGPSSPAAVPPRAQGPREQERERAKREWAQRWERTRAIVIPALRQIGGRRIYCRYDGGNDEGFAWVDSLALQDGQRIDLDTVAQRLHDAEVHRVLRSVGVEPKDPFSPTASGDLLERGALKYFVETLCHEWATMLLGRSFGTGEYSMYGAFTVDLETCIVTDDPGADPVVQNISITR